MIVRIRKGNTDPCEVRIPSSKSLSHRMLIVSALAEGRSVLKNVVRNEDTKATIEALRLLGAEIRETEEEIEVEGIHDFSAYDGSVIDCKESGSTLRFLIPLFAHTGRTCHFTGKGKLLERPMCVYETLFPLFERKKEKLIVQGDLKSGTYEIDGSISSQFVSGLLFLLPLLDGDSRIHLKEPVESLSYIDLTIDVLHMAEIEVRREGNQIFVKGNQVYQPIVSEVSGDDSQAAFFCAFATLAQKEVHIHNMRHDSAQGDRVMLSLMQKSGAVVSEVEDGYKICASEANAIEADLRDCPDLGPVLFALATQLNGTSHFTHTRRLRMKESDRIASMKEELDKLGCEMEYDEDSVAIRGKTEIRKEVLLDGHNDHRIVMALSVLALSSENGCTIRGAEAVNKSYPEFFEDLKKTGCTVEFTEEEKRDD